MKQYYILSVALNEKGAYDCEYSIENDKDIETINLPDEEGKRLFSSGTIDRINAAIGTLIDEFEEDEIENADIDTVLNIVDEKDFPNFVTALKLAQEKHSKLYIAF